MLIADCLVFQDGLLRFVYSKKNLIFGKKYNICNNFNE